MRHITSQYMGQHDFEPFDNPGHISNGYYPWMEGVKNGVETGMAKKHMTVHLLGQEASQFVAGPRCLPSKMVQSMLSHVLGGDMAHKMVSRLVPCP